MATRLNGGVLLISMCPHFSEWSSTANCPTLYTHTVQYPDILARWSFGNVRVGRHVGSNVKNPKGGT